MDGTQSTLSSGKYALRMDLEWGGARQRGGGRQKRGVMDGDQPRVEPSATDSPPQLSGNSKILLELDQPSAPQLVRWTGRLMPTVH